jgi:hypothetical protein
MTSILRDLGAPKQNSRSSLLLAQTKHSKSRRLWTLAVASPSPNLHLSLLPIQTKKVPNHKSKRKSKSYTEETQSSPKKTSAHPSVVKQESTTHMSFPIHSTMSHSPSCHLKRNCHPDNAAIPDPVVMTPPASTSRNNLASRIDQTKSIKS